MISIVKKDNITTNKAGTYVTGELRGLSTDEKPSEINNQKIGNGSVFVEIDTGKIYFYDLENEQWKEV